ncbi:hypothetical protein [Helicobacter sp. 23-1045]
MVLPTPKPPPQGRGLKFRSTSQGRGLLDSPLAREGLKFRSTSQGGVFRFASQ